MTLLLIGIRSLLFYVGYVLSAVLFAPITLLTVVIPFRQRAWFINRWSWFVLKWLYITCNVRVRLTCHYDPKVLRACVVLSNHQSTWEALYLQLLFCPATTVLKRELLMIPFFGWGLRLLEPISINRKKPRLAGKHFMDQGLKSLERDRWVVIFPEGTRVAAGESRPLSLGGFRLAHSAGVPIVPVYHNAGACWPARKFLKYPGLIDCVLGNPIEEEKPQQALAVYEEQMQELEIKVRESRAISSHHQDDRRY